MDKKVYTAFISYADVDKELAIKLKDLFKGMNEKTYFAPISLRERAGGPWANEVILGIKESHCIIPIYTRNSINRPWVLYELGAADASNLPKYPAMVAEISPEEINVPGIGVQIFRLYKEGDLIDLFTKAISLRKISEKLDPTDTKEIVKNALNQLTATKEIIDLAKTRWVFIAGSLPQNLEKEDAQVFKNKVNNFLAQLTKKLLKNGFSLASCPQVQDVGKIVTAEAISLIKKYELGTKRFRIGGIYPIDHDLRQLNIEESLKSTWRDHLHEFRRKYLESQEWLLIVGGNEGTREEYKVAAEMGMKVFSFPCFGGTGKDLWDKYIINRQPCNNCQKKDGNCTDDDISQIVEKLASLR